MSPPREGGVDRVAVEPHPLLDARAFITRFPAPLGKLGAPFTDLLRLQADAPLAPSDTVKKAVRDLLRHGGFKPAGRSKPASEYLIGAAANGRLGPINAAVDACNVTSLHSGLPISVVDLDRAAPPFAVRVAANASYVFNASGQVIDLDGLIVLCDATGPCANPVKDSQRTKTHDGTVATLSVVWGTRALPGRVDEATTWYRSLLGALGAHTEAVEVG